MVYEHIRKHTISVGSGDRTTIVSCNSEGGGLIIAWQDGRNGGSSNYDIYTQKVDAFGFIQWQLDGVAVCTAANSQLTPAMVSDNSGGAIIAWDDSRTINNLDIYAQRIDASGNVKWAMDGIAICTATGVQRNAAVIPDGQGGAIIIWQDHRVGGGNNEIDIYAQRIDSMGVAQWQSDGVPVCTASGRQISPKIVPDDEGGAVIVWQDERGSESDIYAQRIDENGSPQWTLDGISVCSAPSYQESHRIVYNKNNEVLITWVDFRNDITLNSPDIYAQKISNAGTGLWGIDGIAVCTTTDDQYSPVLVNDENGGAIITWDDNRDGDLNIYAQRIDNQGNAQWMSDGIQITDLTSSQDEPVIIQDGNGGAIICWEDLRDSNFDIYAQRIDAAGNFVWQNNGVAISTANASQRYISMISDLNSGAYIIWEDRRAGTNGDDAYSQQVNANGVIGVVTEVNEIADLPASFYLSQNYPNPFNPTTTISYQIKERGLVQLSVYNLLGQEIATIVKEEIPAGIYEVLFDASNLPSGIYIYSLRVNDFIQNNKLTLLK